MRATLLLIFFLMAAGAFGQRATEAGIFFGASNYQGDMAETPVSFSETNFAYGAFYQRFLNPQWGIRGSLTVGRISGKDSNLGPEIQRDRDWTFYANIWEFAGHIQFYPWGRTRFNPTGFLQRHFTPYASVGLGLTFANDKISAPGDEKFKVAETADRNMFFSVPVSVGLRYVMTNRLSLHAEFGQRAVFSDYLDGISKNGNPGAGDWYMFAGLGLTYTFMAEY